MHKSIKALAVIALLGSTACTPFDDAMVAIFGRSMRDQASFDPYENTLMPTEGAISFSSGNFPAAFGDVNVAGPEAHAYNVPDFTQAQTGNPADPFWATFENPLPATAETLARGEVMYNRMCSVCHGTDGNGANASIFEKHQMMGAFNLATGTATGYTDAYIYGMIRVGRGMMPSYGHQITHWDRWAVVNYVRQMQTSAAGGGE